MARYGEKKKQEREDLVIGGRLPNSNLIGENLHG